MHLAVCSPVPAKQSVPIQYITNIYYAMKKRWMLLLMICASLHGFSQNTQVSEVARNGMTSYLDYIPQGLEKQHGFNNREEFSRATTGATYQIMAVDENGNISPTQFYYVAVMVDGTCRAMLTVGEVDGKMGIQSVGAPILAEGLDHLEKELHVAGDANRILLNDYVHKCSFAAYQQQGASAERASFFPLPSAKAYLSQVGSNQSSYTLPELVKAVSTPSK